MIFIKHEDFYQNVVDNFTILFNQLNIKFTDKIKANIIKSSMAYSKPDYLISAQEIHRNSLNNIKTYQQRLTPDEIDFMKRKTKDIASYFYLSNDY